MADERRRIRAPAKILYGLRFKNRCIDCGKVIPPDRPMCNKCNKNFLENKLIKAKKIKLHELKKKKGLI